MNSGKTDYAGVGNINGHFDICDFSTFNTNFTLILHSRDSKPESVKTPVLYLTFTVNMVFSLVAFYKVG